jgi:uncharacterized membrane protein
MNKLQLGAILSGVAFGIWPLLMNRSGLSGNTSSLIFSFIVLICITPFAAGGISAITNANWLMAILAGIVGAIGVMAFNGMLSKATPQNVGTLFVLMIVVQTVTPAVYSVVMNGGISLSKAIGFVLAAIAAILLAR